MNKKILVTALFLMTICAVALGTEGVECQPEDDHCRDTKRSKKREVICRNGEIYHKNCNICSCEEGVFTCTEHLCNGKREAIAAGLTTSSRRRRRETPLAADLKNTPCAPNDYFQIDCNTCYCNTERSGYLCTENIACHKEAESSTTKQITISKDALLFISDHQVQLVKDYNSNDNAISRIAESGGNGDEKSHQTTTVHGVKVAHISEKVSPAPLDKVSLKDATPAPVHKTERTPSVP